MLKYPEASLPEIMRARIASAASHLSVTVRPVGNLIVGGDKRVKPMVYKTARIDDSAGPGWISYNGDRGATRLPIPRLYKRVAITHVDPLLVENYASSSRDSDSAAAPSSLAIAWKFKPGDTVALATPLAVDDLNAIEGAGYYGMRIGRHNLITSLGLLTTEEFQPFAYAIERGWTSKLADAPVDLPIY